MNGNHQPDFARPPGSATHLLVVDDNPRFLASLCPLLVNKGFQVDTVQDGQTACQQAKAKGYDLILLDMAMPGMSGLQVMAWLKREKVDTPVIVVSGGSTTWTVRKALREGAFDYIHKPYNVDDLVATVREVLDRKRLERARAVLQLYLKASEAFYRQAMDQLPEIVFALDPRGHFSFLNHRVKSLLGYEPRSLIGQAFYEFVDERDLTTVALIFAQPSIGLEQPLTIELRLKHHDTQYAVHMFEVTLLPLESDPLRPPSEPGRPLTPAYSFGVAHDISARKEAEAMISYQATHDSLTQLPNRTVFKDRLDLALAHAKRSHNKLAVMFLDLNRFKTVNDTLGHNVGDHLLEQVAQRLKACLREGDTLSRFGGDEFMLLLPAITTRGDAIRIAEKLLQALRQSFSIDEHEISVGASIGIALSPDAGESFEELITRADAAMYVAKRRGEGGFQFYS
ncbi:diguanylate cyclase [Pseudomonas sp. NP21570]|uniref:two-component system response regulator n=1 Tax=Stutzerimonas kunmingensis TaxID=1211807 RepID=UPI001E3679E5|nr:diguanylate cyclase [Stutzerimonas kunmingensis]MCB4797017.1 diguanylate cyclase [Pseudomonas sp. NP21570]